MIRVLYLPNGKLYYDKQKCVIGTYLNKFNYAAVLVYRENLVEV